MPAQTGFAEGVADTLTGKFGFTVTGMGLLVTVCGLAHTADEVTSRVKISLFKSDEVVKELLFVPAELPFTCHW